MRPLEIALATSLVPYLAYLLSPTRAETSWLWIFALGSFALMLCQALFEGFRWQVGLLYLLVFAAIGHRTMFLNTKLEVPYLAAVAALLCLVAAIVLSTLAPVFQLPRPSGTYAIGTDIRHLVDTSRLDPEADIPGSPRELMIQMWYPADPSARGRRAPYREKPLTTFRSIRFSLVETQAVLGASISQAQLRYPVLILAHSWRGQRTENTFQAQELASHGYVVVAIDHPYSSSATVFPDGRIARTKLVLDEDYSSDEAFEKFINAADRQVDLRTQDAIFVLDTLQQFDAHDPSGLLTGRLDFGRVGIFGYSFGGTVAAETCWRDRRFRAGVDMDGMMAGESLRHGTSAPFMFIITDEPAALDTLPADADPAVRRELEFNIRQYQQLEHTLSIAGGYLVKLPETVHSTFSDRPFFSPLRFRIFSGSASAERTARIIARYLVAFFDQQLKAVAQPLLDGRSAESPGVELKVWRAPAAAVPRGT
jgi:dienelactone hydrolase